MRVGAWFCLASIGCAQAVAQEASFRTETVLREVEVRVTNRDGRPVAHLERNDFELFERGEQQQIRTFEYVGAPAVQGGSESEEPVELSRSRFVYISARGSPEDRARIDQGVTKFIDEQARPGVLISIEGSPFSSDKQELRAALEEALEGGRSQDAGHIDRFSRPDPQTLDDFTLGDEEESLDELNSEVVGLLNQAEMLEQFYGRLSLYRYLDLIEALSILPGSKSIVLFAPGLAIDDENLDLLNRLEAEAMKARVRFYMADVRGFYARAPGGDASVSTSRSRRSDPTEVFRAQRETFQDSQDGLFTIAKRTGGKAILNSNDLGEILDTVAEDWSGYYLLGYYPVDTRAEGRFRKIRVEVSHKGLRLDYRRGYYEEQQFERMTKSERRAQIRKAVLGETPFADLPLTVAYDFFRGPHGETILAYGVGVHSRDLILDAGKRGGAVKLTAAAQATPVGRGRPAFDEQAIEREFSPDQLESFASNENALLHYTSQIALTHGEHDWKIVIRDDSSGRMGTFRTKLRVPAFRGPGAASSLLLTGRVEEISAKTRKRSQGALDVRATRFFPDSAHVFQRGAPVYMLFDRYNAAGADLEEPPGAKVALYRGSDPVPSLPISSYEAVPDRARGQIRYVASLDTSSLEPGDYFAVVQLESGYIHQRFTLTPR